jgi:hypothetical protein
LTVIAKYIFERIKMKCTLCNNEIPSIYKNRIACCISPCESFFIKPRTILWKIKVLGFNEQKVLDENRKRTQKAGNTRKSLGLSKGANNPNSKQYLLNLGKSEDEIAQFHKSTAKKMVDTKIKDDFYKVKSNNPYSYEYWISRGYSNEEAKNKIRSKNHNCAEYWISRGYSNEEAKKLSSESADTNSLKAKIKRHKNEGHKKYMETKNKMSGSWNPKSANSVSFSSSQSANAFFKKIYKFVRRLGFTRHEMTFKLNFGKEFWIKKDKKIYFYDFVLHPLRLIVEFNGEHVHVDPGLSLEEKLKWKHAFSKMDAFSIEEYDKQKNIAAAARGYKIIYVWYKDQESGFNSIVDFLKEKYNHGTKD